MNTDLIELQHTLTNDKGTIKTTSLEIARHFGKNHRHVLRDIKQLGCSEQFRVSNFGLCFKYNELAKQEQPYYNLTKDGFTMLCMGYTGRKAMYWKELYIEAFNQLQQRVADQSGQIDRLRHHLETLKTELLNAKPMWRRIYRYKNLGLNHAEISHLVALNVATIRRHVRRMEACGLLAHPKNLAGMQRMAVRLHAVGQ